MADPVSDESQETMMKITWTELATYESEIDEATLRDLTGEHDTDLDDLAVRLSRGDEVGGSDLSAWLDERTDADFAGASERRIEAVDFN